MRNTYDTSSTWVFIGSSLCWIGASYLTHPPLDMKVTDFGPFIADALWAVRSHFLFMFPLILYSHSYSLRMGGVDHKPFVVEQYLTRSKTTESSQTAQPRPPHLPYICRGPSQGRASRTVAFHPSVRNSLLRSITTISSSSKVVALNNVKP